MVRGLQVLFEDVFSAGREKVQYTMKNIRKHLWSILRMLAPCSIGFALLCVGGYLVLQKLQYTDTGGLVMGCILMSCGFLAIFTSVTWNICQRVKRKVDQRRRRRQQNVQVYTVERSVSVHGITL